MERAVELVQEKVLSQLLDEGPAASIKEKNERLAEKARAFNGRLPEIDQGLTRLTIIEGKEKDLVYPWLRTLKLSD